MQTEKQVKVIMPTIGDNAVRKLRVEAYCRVSTDSEDQLNSFLAQVRYYTDFINRSANMILVDVYADEGITGTCVNKRDEFLRMVKDCKLGRIDRIYVKSVSRFARNSLECIENIRLLKSYGVSVLFENDGIDTENMNSEMILYIKSAFAQSESLSGSKRVSTAIRMKMQNGEFSTYTAPYGYEIKDGKLVPIIECQPIIEKIFHDYLSGKGKGKIAEELNAIEDTGRVWNAQGVDYILTNEKYIGDSLLQKTYTPQVFPLRNIPNKGEVEKYYVTNTHEPMISRELFDSVQRKKEKNRIKKAQDKKRTPLAFSKKIYCGNCGWTYKIHTSVNDRYWSCSKDGISGFKCGSINVCEKDLKKAFINLFNKLKLYRVEIIDSTISTLIRLKTRIASGNSEIQEIDEELARLSSENSMYVKLRAKGIMDDVSFMEQTADLQKRLTELRTRRIKLLNADEDEQSIESLKILKAIIEENDYQLLFDQGLFEKITRRINIYSDNYAVFELKCGLKFKEQVRWD